MDRDKIKLLLIEARKITKHPDYVIIGSLSILGKTANPPPSMVTSVDVDLYPKLDPGRASEIADALGIESEFYRVNDFYADAVSPKLPSLPEGWEQRLIMVELEPMLRAWFLEPNDAAVSKYARGAPHDRAWIRAGLEAGLLSTELIEARLRETVMETAEKASAREAFQEDREWLGRQSEFDDFGPSGPAMF